MHRDSGIGKQAPLGSEFAKCSVKKYFCKWYFDFTTNHEFDHDSNKNLEHLKSETDNLKKLVMWYLSKKMQ